ncbi:MAG: WD repeat-containing protein 63 [Marteilia pararefringens]
MQPGEDHNFQPLFLSEATQKILFPSLVVESLTQWKLLRVTREAVLEDIWRRAAVSDLQPLKAEISSLEENSTVLFVADPDFLRGENFLISVNPEGIERYQKDLAEASNNNSNTVVDDKAGVIASDKDAEDEIMSGFDRKRLREDIKQRFQNQIDLTKYFIGNKCKEYDEEDNRNIMEIEFTDLNNKSDRKCPQSSSRSEMDHMRLNIDLGE